jgi:hypothetical protein
LRLLRAGLDGVLVDIAASDRSTVVFADMPFVPLKDPGRRRLRIAATRGCAGDLGHRVRQNFDARQIPTHDVLRKASARYVAFFSHGLGPALVANQERRIWPLRDIAGDQTISPESGVDRTCLRSSPNANDPNSPSEGVRRVRGLAFHVTLVICFVNMGRLDGGGVGGAAGEITNVSQAFHPDARCWARLVNAEDCIVNSIGY